MSHAKFQRGLGGHGQQRREILTQRDGGVKDDQLAIIHFQSVSSSRISHAVRRHASLECEYMTRSSGRARAKQWVIKTTPSESANWTTEGEGSEPGDQSQPTETQQHRRSGCAHKGPSVSPLQAGQFTGWCRFLQGAATPPPPTPHRRPWQPGKWTPITRVITVDMWAYV